MKKLIALLLAVVMVFGLVACGGNTTPETTKPAETTPSAGKKTVKVDKGIVAAAVATVVGAAASLAFGIANAIKKRKK